MQLNPLILNVPYVYSYCLSPPLPFLPFVSAVTLFMVVSSKPPVFFHSQGNTSNLTTHNGSVGLTFRGLISSQYRKGREEGKRNQGRLLMLLLCAEIGAVSNVLHHTDRWQFRSIAPWYLLGVIKYNKVILSYEAIFHHAYFHYTCYT